MYLESVNLYKNQNPKDLSLPNEFNTFVLFQVVLDKCEIL